MDTENDESIFKQLIQENREAINLLSEYDKE